MAPRSVTLRTFDLGGVVAANLAFAISSFFILQPILTRLSGSQEVATALLLATALSPTMEVTALSETGGWLTVWMTALAALPVATLLTPSTPPDRALARVVDRDAADLILAEGEACHFGVVIGGDDGDGSRAW